MKKTLINDEGYSHEIYQSKLGEFSYHGTKQSIVNILKNNILCYIKKHNGSILDHNIDANYSSMTKYSVRFASVRGNANKQNGLDESFYSLICQNYNENMCDETFRYSNAVWSAFKNQMCIWSFNNKYDQLNFINYCRTKVIRFLLTFTKTNINIIGGQITKIIPWLDFTQEWDDAKLCKEFGISEELWEYINNFIPDYYEDYKSGF